MHGLAAEKGGRGCRNRALREGWCGGGGQRPNRVLAESAGKEMEEETDERRPGFKIWLKTGQNSTQRSRGAILLIHEVPLLGPPIPTSPL